MPNEDHLKILRQGVEAWNTWRQKNSTVMPDLVGADLVGADLHGANLRGADLRRANLDGADLVGADLHGANLRGAILHRAKFSGANLCRAILRRAELEEVDLHEIDLRGADLRRAELDRVDLRGAKLRRANFNTADLSEAKLSGTHLPSANLGRTDLGNTDLSGAKLRRANLYRANLRETNLSGADLGGADLRHALLVNTCLAKANLTGCRVYGISAWNLNLEGVTQKNLIITKKSQPAITVDNLEVAQFVYLLLNNKKIRDVIDTIGKKAVLILGRFTPERKAILDALREELRKRDYLPILFDFERPAGQTITETVSLLARMARFVVADITDAKSMPQELSFIVPFLPSVPVQPLLLEGSGEYSMFEHFRPYPWVLPTHVYASPERLIVDLGERVIGPAEAKARAVRAVSPPAG